METITKTTQLVEVKQLRTGVRPDTSTWELVLVTDLDGTRYTTFLASMAYKAVETGMTVKIAYTEKPSIKQDKDGNPLTDRDITGLAFIPMTGDPDLGAKVEYLLAEVKTLRTALVEAGIEVK